MRKLFLAIALSFIASFACAEWLELYIPYCGNAIYAGDSTFYGTMTSSLGVVNVHETFQDLEAPTTTFIYSTTITTAALVSGTTCVRDESAFTMPRSPRNVIVGIKVGGETALLEKIDASSNSVSGTCKLEGFDSEGFFRYETIITSSVLNVNYSSYTYSRILCSTWTFSRFTGKDWGTNTDLGTIEFHMGIGPKIGLANDILCGGNAGSVYKVQENGTNIRLTNSSLVINPTYNNIDFVTNPTATADYDVWYKANGR